LLIHLAAQNKSQVAPIVSLCELKGVGIWYETGYTKQFHLRYQVFEPEEVTVTVLHVTLVISFLLPFSFTA
jgi:hypothetical protein